MRSNFSKPAADVALESLKQLENNAALVERQRRLAAVLSSCPDREVCILCGQVLQGAPQFKHRGVDYAICSGCQHIQSKAQPPAGYPARQADGVTFAQIYPELTKAEYESRKQRIYRPKLDWILDCHAEVARSREALIGARWLDLGCGAGYFLEALRDVGVRDGLGLEENPDLVTIANRMLGQSWVQRYTASLAEAVQQYPADIYTAFFVLEHTEDPRAFFEALRQRPPGTLLVFAVPTFGFTTLLESSFDGHFARQLDSGVHTQLYTDASIHYALTSAGYEMAAQWVFGQDALDLVRLLRLRLREVYSEGLLDEVTARLADLQDAVQQVLDRQHFADSRHVIAIKR